MIRKILVVSCFLFCFVLSCHTNSDDKDVKQEEKTLKLTKKVKIGSFLLTLPSNYKVHYPEEGNITHGYIVKGDTIKLKFMHTYLSDKFEVGKNAFVQNDTFGKYIRHIESIDDSGKRAISLSFLNLQDTTEMFFDKKKKYHGLNIGAKGVTKSQQQLYLRIFKKSKVIMEEDGKAKIDSQKAEEG